MEMNRNKKIWRRYGQKGHHVTHHLHVMHANYLGVCIYLRGALVLYYYYNRLTFGVDRAVWTLTAKMDDGAPWHKGVFKGAEKFMTAWHKEEEEASRRRATKRDFRDLEPPTHFL